MRFEYKAERFDYDLLAMVDRRTFDQRLAAFLNEHGGQGWELKSCFHDFGFHLHLVFGRQVVEEPEST